MDQNCAKHTEYQTMFVNLKQNNNESRLLCEICIQEQVESSSLNLISISALKGTTYNQYQKLLQFVDEENILIPYINFDLVKNGTLESINSFYDELSTSLLSFVEAKRNSAQKCYFGLVEAQTKLQKYAKLDELKQIFRKQDDIDSLSIEKQVNEFFESQLKNKTEILEYLKTCTQMTDSLESFKNIKDKISEIKEKFDTVLKLEDDLSDLKDLSLKETKKVGQLRGQINSLTSQLQKIVNSKTQLDFPQSKDTSYSQSVCSTDLYKLDIINKSKDSNHLMKKIADAIRTNKFFIPLQIKKSEDGLVFSRDQSGDSLLGIIDVPLNFDVYGKSFKIKVLQGFVYIGICARDINVKRNYRLDTQIYSPSSGYILFNSSGYTYSSFNPSQHNIYLKSHFSADSIVTITPCDNKFTFHVENFKKTDYYFQPEDDIVYTPCFALSENSSIEFLEE